MLDPGADLADTDALARKVGDALDAAILGGHDLYHVGVEPCQRLDIGRLPIELVFAVHGVIGDVAHHDGDLIEAVGDVVDVLHGRPGRDDLHIIDQIAGLEDALERAADGIIGAAGTAGAEDQADRIGACSLRAVFAALAIAVAAIPLGRLFLGGRLTVLRRLVGIAAVVAATGQQGTGQPQRGRQHQSTSRHSQSSLGCPRNRGR